jgi:hypothetical protein
MGRERLANKQ